MIIYQKRKFNKLFLSNHFLSNPFMMIPKNKPLMDIKSISDKIFEIKSANDFAELAIQIFQLQYKNNLIYKRYIDLIGVNPYEDFRH